VSLVKSHLNLQVWTVLTYLAAAVTMMDSKLLLRQKLHAAVRE
jgi:hypothetical protein